MLKTFTFLSLFFVQMCNAQDYKISFWNWKLECGSVTTFDTLHRTAPNGFPLPDTVVFDRTTGHEYQFDTALIATKPIEVTVTSCDGRRKYKIEKLEIVLEQGWPPKYSHWIEIGSFINPKKYSKELYPYSGTIGISKIYLEGIKEPILIDKYDPRGFVFLKQWKMK